RSPTPSARSSCANPSEACASRREERGDAHGEAQVALHAHAPGLEELERLELAREQPGKVGELALDARVGGTVLRGERERAALEHEAALRAAGELQDALP